MYTDIINGIEISVLDIPGSKTAEHVFNEFKNNQYGLEDLDIRSTDLVIDVGANIGIFSIYVKKKFGCNIISFEPVPSIYDLFKTNIELNNLLVSDFDLHNSAITDNEDSIIEIGTPYDNSGGSSKFYRDGWKISECKTERLNKYLDEKCKYLKIDCEGSEYDIIPGIIDKLSNIENIGIEYHKIDNLNYDPNFLHRLLSSNFNGGIYTNIELHNK